MLVTQQVGRLPTEPNTVISGGRPVPANPGSQNAKRSSSSGCVTSRGNCCFYRVSVQAPRLGGAPGRECST